MWVTILTDPDGYKLDSESPPTSPRKRPYSQVFPKEPTPKINSQKPHNFRPQKTAHPQSIFATHSTTFCPQKNHVLHPNFPKTPSKNALFPQRKIPQKFTQNIHRRTAPAIQPGRSSSPESKTRVWHLGFHQFIFAGGVRMRGLIRFTYSGRVSQCSQNDEAKR
jgi:hypothetical protein